MWYSNCEMKKIIFSILIVISCVVFATSIFSHTQVVADENQENSEVLKFPLIEQFDNNDIYTSFLNFQNSQLVQQPIQYIINGQLKESSCVIERTETNPSTKVYEAWGNGAYQISEEIKQLSQIANVYVRLEVGALALSSSERDKLIFSLNVGDKEQTITSNRVYESGITGSFQPEILRTERILIENETEINFSFETKTAFGSSDSSKGFYIFEPKIIFEIEIEDITNITESKDVFAGEKIQLNASNLFTKNNYGEISNYLKEYFYIEWEIVEGNATINKDILLINSESGKVVVRAKCKKSSASDEYIYSKNIEFVINKNSGVGIVTNFENSFSQYYLSGNQVILTIEDNYLLQGVKNENGEGKDFIQNNNEVIIKNINTNEKNNLFLEFKKILTIDKIEIEDKVYDQTTNASISNIITNAQTGHDIQILGLSAVFESENANVNKNVLIYGNPQLVGEDANLYQLSSEFINESGEIINVNSSATIYKKQITVIADLIEKKYGDKDPELTYQVLGILPNDQLEGSLSRALGENIGEYIINKGSLNNDNYQIFFKSNILTITYRTITITDIIISSKEYDKTLDITTGEDSLFIQEDSYVYMNGDLKILFNSQDILEGSSLIEIEAEAHYITSEAGVDKEVFLNFYLSGADRDKYILENDIVPKGTIIPKNIDVKAISNTKQFGFADPVLKYEITGLLDGDILGGNIERDSGEAVGEYTIRIGSLNNPNYKINFTEASFTITRRLIEVKINDKQKQYLDQDPDFTYVLMSGAEVSGYPIDIVLSREEGELIGEYMISVKSYDNSNYLISNIEEAKLIINKRNIGIEINVSDKQFDGNSKAEHNLSYINLPNENPDGIALKNGLSSNFQDINIGFWAISYYLQNEIIETFDSNLINGENLNCYQFQFDVQQEAEIYKRKITISYEFPMQKQYGYKDPLFNSFKFENEFENMISFLSFEIVRDPGEEVGLYKLYFVEPSEDANKNFEITIAENYYFEIIKRVVLIEVENKTKIYGEEDPNIVYYLSSSTPLPEGILFENLVMGSPSRAPGENAGRHPYNLGTLSIVKEEQSRYELVISNSYLDIIPRDIEITIHDKNKQYGDPTPEFTYEITSGSLVNLEDLIIVTNSNDNAGTWEIFPLINTNYNVIYQKGIYTITPAPITLSPIDKTKIYGEKEVELEVEIINGTLKKNDTLKSILIGALVRDPGEDVGKYQISQGTLKTNQNYEMTYTGSAVFEIIPKNITVKADQKNLYLDELPFIGEFTYTIEPNLIEGDLLEGELYVDEIIDIGVYEISIGTLQNKNYNINFVGNSVIVVKRKLYLKASSYSMIYNSTNNYVPSYQILSNSEIKEGHDKDYFGIIATTSSSVNVGEYPVLLNYGLIDGILNSQRKEEIDKYYDVVIEEGLLKITAAKITFEINDIEIIYGDLLPEDSSLTYKVVSGTNYNDEISVLLNWSKNKNAGRYQINYSYINDGNYIIETIPGYITINKKPIIIKIFDAEKTYGEEDPLINYSIETPLIEGDSLQEKIIRIEGENVGSYQIKIEYNNENYNVSYNNAYLKINKRPLKISISVKDKIYDGNNNVETSFNINNLLPGDLVLFSLSANFIDQYIGDNKEIIYSYNITGQDAKNYYVEIVNQPTANITRKSITKDNVTITVAEGNTSLTENVVLYIEKISAGNEQIIKGRDTLFGYKIVLIKDGKPLENIEELTIKITLLPEETEKKFELYLSEANKNIEYNLKNKTVTFTTSSLGQFLFVEDNSWPTIYYVLIGIGAAAVLSGIIATIIVINKKKKEKKKSLLKK